MSTLIERCLEELKKYEGLTRFNLQGVKIAFYCQPEKEKADNPVILFETYTQKGYCEYVWEAQFKKDKIYIIQTLLSRTPDGEAVMPFLDVEIKDKEYGGYLQSFDYKGRKLIRYTLDNLLYREFTEALRVGKTVDEALQIIEKIYQENMYEER